jgi:hypothetical protein
MYLNELQTEFYVLHTTLSCMLNSSMSAFNSFIEGCKHSYNYLNHKSYKI